MTNKIESNKLNIPDEYQKKGTSTAEKSIFSKQNQNDLTKGLSGNTSDKVIGDSLQLNTKGINVADGSSEEAKWDEKGYLGPGYYYPDGSLADFYEFK